MSKEKNIFTTRARAKINLTLHVGDAQANGYHPLHSLVVFADIGDGLTAKMADTFSLEIDGPFATGLSCGPDNLVLTTAQHAALLNGVHIKLAYKLTKNLPVSSGIGGGSADAAAAVRLLEDGNGETPGSLDYMLIESGADIPACYHSKTCIMEGIGEMITPLPKMGHLHVVLVNPGISVSTGEIFKAFDDHGHSSDFQLQGDTLLEMAMSGSNDLQAISITATPVIQTVIDALTRQDNCQLARMSGSGATCFGVFKSELEAEMATEYIQKKHPDWWCVQTTLGDRSI